jgi:hypothetical protein
MELPIYDYEKEQPVDPKKELAQWQIKDIEKLVSKHMADLKISELKARQNLADIMINIYKINNIEYESGFDYFDKMYELTEFNKEDDLEMYKIQKELVINYLR